VRVTVKLFARLKDVTGAAELVHETSRGATVGSVWHDLVGRFPALREYERSISCAVNEDYAKMTHELSDGDEIAFLPPVSGG